MPDRCVEEKRGAGHWEAVERNSDATVTVMVLRRLSSAFPASREGSDVIPAIQCCRGIATQRRTYANS